MVDALINRILRAPTGFGSRVQIAWLRLCGMQIGQHCRLVRASVPRNPWDILLHEGVALDERVVLLSTGTRSARHRIEIGPGTYVNRSTIFDASLSITVGANVMIGPHCYITDHDHGTKPGQTVASQPLIEAPVVIEENVWIGAGVIVLKGVRIGQGAVVAAGAVVTRDVAAGAKIRGVPARGAH